MPLRGYLDIALYLQKYGHLLTGDALKASASRWKTGYATPFILRLVTDLFALPLPAALRPFCPDGDTHRLAQAFEALFDLPAVQTRNGETTFLRFKRASAFGRLHLVLSRIFMPRAFLMIYYPSARHLYGLPYAWARRVCALHRRNSHTIHALLLPGTQIEHPLANAERRTDLVKWLLRQP
jgi:hypothetical protein